jgi:hypothetical protein
MLKCAISYTVKHIKTNDLQYKGVVSIKNNMFSAYLLTCPPGCHDDDDLVCASDITGIAIGAVSLA